MKKFISFLIIFILSFSTATPVYPLHADKPFDEAAQQEAAAYVAAHPDDIIQQFIDGHYQLTEYEKSVSDSYVSHFLNEAAQTPMLKNFNVEQYAEIAPQILFIPREMMFALNGYAYNRRIIINFGRGKVSTDDYKRVAAHELLHLGTNGLAAEWLDEAFVVLGMQRTDEVAGRETYKFSESAEARNDLRLGELIAQLIGGEDEFARMACEKNAHELIGQAFDAAQSYVPFADFSFANTSIRVNNKDEDFKRNLEYLEYIVENRQPSGDDGKLAEIRAFYALPTQATAEKFAKGLSVLVNGYETPAECLDRITRRVFINEPDKIFSSAEGDALMAMEDHSLQLAYELITPAPVTEGYFLWADAVTALKLTRFVDDNELGVPARSVMDDATAYALVGKLVETAFTPESLADYNSFPACAQNAYAEMGEVFAERTGNELSALFTEEKTITAPNEMLKQIVTECFVNPAVSGVLDKEKAIAELKSYREDNFDILEGRQLLGIVDEGILAI